MAKNTTDNMGLDEETIKNMAELVGTVKMLEGYMNDQIVQDLAGIIAVMGKLGNAAVSTDLVDVMERAVQDPELDRALANPKAGGMVAIAKSMADKDVQRGMFIMLSLLKAIGKASRQ